MERILHQYKPDKRRLPTKTHRPLIRDGINQRCIKDTKENTEAVADLLWKCPKDHFRQYAPLSSVLKYFWSLPSSM